MSLQVDFSSLTDSELAEKIARIIHKDIFDSYDLTVIQDEPTSQIFLSGHPTDLIYFDINTPEYLMPLQLENRISLAYTYSWRGSESWEARCNSIQIRNESPYRAIAICYLTMMESE